MSEQDLNKIQKDRKKFIYQSRRQQKANKCKFLFKNKSLFEPFISSKKLNQIFKQGIKSKIKTNYQHFDRNPPYIGNFPYYSLRDYQIEGVDWLLQQYNYGLGGILADEMGLGKTIQILAFISYLNHEHKVNGPQLIVCPLSVLLNWEKEAKKWVPDLLFYSIKGQISERNNIFSQIGVEEGLANIYFTTYETLHAEMEWFCSIVWDVVVLDEAHRIKNHKGNVRETVDSLNRSMIFLLTGTPLQNNITELWSLIHLLLPHIYLDASSFQSSIDLDNDQILPDMLLSTRKLLGLLMFRRTKDQVEMLLPPKVESNIFLPLTPLQIKYYRKVLHRDPSLKNVLSLSQLNFIMMQLRKISNHPATLITNKSLNFKLSPDNLVSQQELVQLKMDTLGENLVSCSCKFIFLEKFLSRLYTQKSRVLIFSQFTSFLDLLEQFVQLNLWKYKRMDGNTNRIVRQMDMEDFNHPKSDIFLYLISTRAGGLGINLPTADTVILCDSDWNPQNDLQAASRAHRIGQTKTVRVYRLISECTVEECILQRAQKKLYLDAMMIGNGENNDINQPFKKPKRNYKSKNISQNPESLDMTHVWKMLKFGVNNIFKSKGVDASQIDLDEILNRKHLTNENDDISENIASSTIFRLESKYNRLKLEDALDLSSSIKFNDNSIKEQPDYKSTTSFECPDSSFNSTFDYSLVNENFILFEKRKRSKVKLFEPEDYEDNSTKTKRKLNHESYCFICEDGGELLMCNLCPKVYHIECLHLNEVPSGFWICPWHSCWECDKSQVNAGGVLFRCVYCPISYCFECKPSELIRIEPSPEFFHNLEKNNYSIKNSIFIKCSNCHKWFEEERIEKEKKRIEKEQERIEKEKKRIEKEQERQKKLKQSEPSFLPYYIPQNCYIPRYNNRPNLPLLIQHSPIAKPFTCLIPAPGYSITGQPLPYPFKIPYLF